MSLIHLPKAATISLLAWCLVLGGNPALAASGGRSAGGGGASADRVPWMVLGPDEAGPGGPLGVLWFPLSDAETKESGLLTSAKLGAQSTRCVGMVIVAPENRKVRAEFEIAEPGTGVVLVDRNNEVAARIVYGGSPIEVGHVERMVEAELDRRERDATVALEAANQKINEKDIDGAEALLTWIWRERCVVPDHAKKAAKALKKIGRPVDPAARR